MVAAVSSTNDTQNTNRPPLLPSEQDNKNGLSNNHRKPKSRIVSSRYMSSPSTSTSTSNSSSVSSSSSSSRRFPSPLVSRNSTQVPNTPKRAVSADRRRPTAARPLISDLDKSGDVSAAAKMLVTSTRRFSVSFQGESFTLPISKTKVTPVSPNVSNLRKGTPERRRIGTPLRGKGDVEVDQVENCKRVDQQRWPARNRSMNPMIRTLEQSMNDERRLSLDLSNSDLLKAFPRARDGNSDLTASDSDSVSSGSTSEIQENNGDSLGQNGPRGIIASTRFWQETNSRLRRFHDLGPHLSTSLGSKLIASSKLKRITSDGPLSSPRTMPSPVRNASPNKTVTPVGPSPSRGYSPARIRNVVSTISNNFCETPSVLSFAVDVRRGKVGENRIVDAHLLRLVYNRHLQWRFVNARTEGVLMVQKHRAEKNLWNAWITISDLRDTVTKKSHRLQLLKQKLKLAAILKGQMTFLENWSSFDKDHSISLVGAIEALKASTLRLPVGGGAIANVQSLKDAIGSAVDVMQAMDSSISSRMQMVEEVNTLVTELAKATAQERALLQQCMDYITLLSDMQVKDNSLRMHILQHNRVSITP